MENFLHTDYQANKSSISIDSLGMREMQRRAYAKSESQYLLLKSPPASGKSRALMYIALEKLKRSQVKKVIVAVPERSIAKSFTSTRLSQTGFHTDWEVRLEYDLCSAGGGERKTAIFKRFMESDEKVLLCTHATLRFAFDQIGHDSFNDCLIAIDEFHHVSSAVESKLGELLRTIIYNTNAHILAMTGSYFRGDSIAVMSYQDEQLFEKVTYNYYEQLNGYEYLKSLGIGFHFYTGSYLDSLHEVIDSNRKTIIHIPSVNASESTKEKLLEVDAILECLGIYEFTDENGVIHVRRKDGKLLKIADLVNDDFRDRERIMGYLRSITSPDDIDMIIALGMAKEGFDWPFCDTTLTIGYRGSLTEIIQIIGRCTRDSKNKTHAQFTNLIAEPSATRQEVTESVNNILKAIAASLLMEEVMAPKFSFRSKENVNTKEIHIKGFREPNTERARNIIENDLIDLQARILQSPEIQASFPGIIPAETLNRVLIPKIIKEVYPQLEPNEIGAIGDCIIANTVFRHSSFSQQGNDKLILFANRLINVNEMDMDLIYSINPFQNAFEIMSKQLSPKVFKAVQQYIKALKVRITDDEAAIYWPKIQEFYQVRGRMPNPDSLDPIERRMAEAFIYIQQVEIQRQRNG